VDGEGRKMSKSIGNTVSPQDIANKMGAEIIRLWVASTDYSGELSISDEILKRVVESYRRIRNTLRFLLSNLSDYDHAKHALPASEWLEIDRYAVALTERLQKEVLSHYDAYEFHPVVAKLQTFCSEDLGGFYLDVLKDRLYTTAVDSKARRAAQNALYHITQAMLHWMAPFLSFTAEEAWKVFAHGTGHTDTIFPSTYYTLPGVDEADDLLQKWHTLREVRAEVTKQLEAVRVEGAIGSSLQAEVNIQAGGPVLAALQSLGDDLRFVLLTSAATVTHAPEAGDLLVTVAASEHAKCERCWHYRADVGQNPDHPTLCGRCDSNLFGAGEHRSHA
jgi:isoleucyl-tRNA synthetase